MIARKSTLILLITLFVSLLGYVGLIFIYRFGLDYEYGVIAFAMAYVGLFSYMTNLGVSLAHIKHVSEGKDLGTCIGTYAVIKMALIGIMVLVVLFSILFWKYILGRGFESSEHEIVIYLMIAFYVMIELANIANHTFSARKETAKEQIPAIFNPVVRVPIVILVAFFSLGVFWLAGAYILGAAAFLLVSMILFRGYPIKSFDKRLFKRYSRFALPLIASGALGTMMRHIDKIMIQLFWSSLAVGYYFSVERIIFIILMIPTALTTLLLPQMSEYHGKEDFRKIRKLLHVSYRYVSMIVIPCVIILIVLSEPILYLLSGSIAKNASTLLQIMALYAFFASSLRLYSTQIVAVGRPGVVAKIGITMSLTNISLNILLIPTSIFSVKLFGLGATGAAIALLISAVVGFVLYGIAAYKITGNKPPHNILLHLLSGCIMGFTLFGLTEFFNIVIHRWYEIAGICLIGLGIYLGVLYILREFNRRDLDLFLHAVNPRGMKDYVTNELKEKHK